MGQRSGSKGESTRYLVKLILYMSATLDILSVGACFLLIVLQLVSALRSKNNISHLSQLSWLNFMHPTYIIEYRSILLTSRSCPSCPPRFSPPFCSSPHIALKVHNGKPTVVVSYEFHSFCTVWDIDISYIWTTAAVQKDTGL